MRSGNIGKIAGKVIIITGGSAGIGAATARAMAKAGAKLVLAARRLDKLESVAAECRQLGAQTLVVQADVAKREDVVRLVAAAIEKFQRLDVMIANAGYGFLTPIHEVTDQQFDDIFNTNVKGTWYAMQAAARVMLEQQPTGRGKAARGHIIAVSSGAARRSMPLYGIYSMTKAAQLSLVEAMRVEMIDRGIYVSSIHPLTTATDFFDVASSKSRVKSVGLGRPYTADSVARAIMRLIRHPRPESWPVLGSRWALMLAIAIPSMTDRMMARLIHRRIRP